MPNVSNFLEVSLSFLGYQRCENQTPKDHCPWPESTRIGKHRLRELKALLCFNIVVLSSPSYTLSRSLLLSMSCTFPFFPLDLPSRSHQSRASCKFKSNTNRDRDCIGMNKSHRKLNVPNSNHVRRRHSKIEISLYNAKKCWNIWWSP